MTHVGSQQTRGPPLSPTTHATVVAVRLAPCLHHAAPRCAATQVVGAHVAGEEAQHLVFRF